MSFSCQEQGLKGIHIISQNCLIWSCDCTLLYLELNLQLYSQFTNVLYLVSQKVEKIHIGLQELPQCYLFII